MKKWIAAALLVLVVGVALVSAGRPQREIWAWTGTDANGLTRTIWTTASDSTRTLPGQGTIVDTLEARRLIVNGEWPSTFSWFVSYTSDAAEMDTMLTAILYTYENGVAIKVMSQVLGEAVEVQFDSTSAGTVTAGILHAVVLADTMLLKIDNANVAADSAKTLRVGARPFFTGG